MTEEGNPHTMSYSTACSPALGVRYEETAPEKQTLVYDRKICQVECPGGRAAGGCVSVLRFCDGAPDCADGSDEENYFCSAVSDLRVGHHYPGPRIPAPGESGLKEVPR